MTYAQLARETCFIELREGRANKIVEGQLPENSVKKEGVCEQEVGRQYLFVLCDEEDIL